MDLLIAVYLNLLPVIAIYSSLWFLLSLILKRNDIADIAWGLGFLLTICYLLYFGYFNVPALIVFGLVSFWGIRLSLYIVMRIRLKPEDFRYQKWRIEWGRWVYLRSYVQVFLFQGLIMSIIALPLLAIGISGSSNSVLFIIPGITLWLVGFYWQVVADNQLNTFKKNPENKGQFIKSGLWAKSRHPNYFGEIAMWWGVFLSVVPYSNVYWVVIASPMLITLLLRYVSGVPMLENRYINNPEYQRYKKHTPVLIPKLFSGGGKR